MACGDVRLLHIGRKPMKTIQRSILLIATILIIYFASANSAPSATAGEWTLTLTAGENTAYRNGEAFELAGKPYIQDHTFYFSLQEVAEALGGTYREYDDTAKIGFPAYTAEYHVEKNNYAVNGENVVADAHVRCFPTDSSGTYYNTAADRTPVRHDGMIYFPLGFTGVDAPDRYAPGINSLRYAADKMVIISTVQNDDCLIDSTNPENRLAAGMAFSELPRDISAELQPSDDKAYVLNYVIENYQSNDLKISVMRRLTGEDTENMDGKICNITACSPRFRTPRGLKTGDTEQSITILYGAWDDPFLVFSTENDRVATIELRKNYYKAS